ncbi:deacylase [Paenibacillus baekrokdamisoli]|uniref:Deacylase n=1 Tax=Paenibacillus baekrokdamisoli TaxID=1712516 RepID=A0A3G9IU55_9BACL|nr:M20 family metallopeptidase [Paenibacillus baekrokdamisoli]MBB3071572.1 acetylornithine deacetylase/succinyl-diaminopimelate desuccinylase-like protein [Paenibacillus baekrokdamisoli]BBH21916.1 deacylase [Paenibacillus baekrokdamisoli]
MEEHWLQIDAERIAADTLRLVRIASPTGDSREIAAAYQSLLEEVGCKVERYEFIPNNPTLVATFEDDFSGEGKSLIFNGHMDVVPLEHEPARFEEGVIHGRGTCDMKGSLACIVEVLRVLGKSQIDLPGRVIVVANSMHESPGGRGEDLEALINNVELRADAALVMEGARYDSTVAQLGSATFEIAIIRDGEPTHQLYTAPGTPHPITVSAEIVRRLCELNLELEKHYIEDTGYASYFIGSLHSGQFYNQHPNRADIVGVRRFDPRISFAEVEKELRGVLDEIAEQYQVSIELDMRKVRDGYRIDKNDPAVFALQAAVRKVRGIELPLVGKKVVVDAGFFVNGLGIPTVCHGPDQSSSHGEHEFAHLSDLEQTAQVYLQFIQEYLIHSKGR